MNKVAIISAAGWKGAGYESNLAGCPECFLPLGDGTTSLSRSATVLSENGHDVHIAIGKRGYPYSKYVRWAATPIPPTFPDDFPWDGSPWTQERYNHAEQFGTVIEMPDPGGWTTSFDTFCVAMDAIGEENWEHLLLARGDMLIPRHLFESIIEIGHPFVFLFTAFHSYFGLNLEGARFLRSYMEPFRRFATRKSWKSDKNMAPDHWGTMALKNAGFAIRGRDSLPLCKWTDIDVSAVYRSVCESTAEEVHNRKESQ